MKFTVAFLKDTKWGDGAKVVEDEPTGDTSRWADYHSMVFEHEGKLYGTEYRRGTGDSGERPWEFEKDEEEVECPEMVAVQVTVTKYVEKRSEPQPT